MPEAELLQPPMQPLVDKYLAAYTSQLTMLQDYTEATLRHMHSISIPWRELEPTTDYNQYRLALARAANIILLQRFPGSAEKWTPGKPPEAEPLQPSTDPSWLTSIPTGAHLYIDGKDTFRTTPVQIHFRPSLRTTDLSPITPGSHQVKLTLSGYDDLIETQDLPPGRSLNNAISFTLVRTQRPFADTIRSSPPGAKIFIDGQDTGETTSEKIYSHADPTKHDKTTFSPGVHTLKLTLPGYTDMTTQIRLGPGDGPPIPYRYTLEKIEEPITPEPEPLPTPVITPTPTVTTPTATLQSIDSFLSRGNQILDDLEAALKNL